MARPKKRRPTLPSTPERTPATSTGRRFWAALGILVVAVCLWMLARRGQDANHHLPTSDSRASAELPASGSVERGKQDTGSSGRSRERSSHELPATASADPSKSLNKSPTKTSATREASSAAELSCVPGLADRSSHAPLADLFAKASPSSDPEWQSEQWSEQAGQQLAHLAELCERLPSIKTDDLVSLVSESYAGPDLRPGRREVYRDGVLMISRQANGATETWRGRAGFLQQLQQWLALYDHSLDHPPHLKFKIIRTERTGDRLLTTAYVETYGVSAQHSSRQAQQTATWTCHWLTSSPETPPILEQVVVSELEEVEPASARTGSFIDCTESLFAHCPSYAQQLVYGADHWYGNMDVAFGIHHGNQGLALGDANGDGREDLFLCQPAGLPCRLYLQQPDGTLVDATQESGLDWLDASRSALFADFDNDGDQDLAVSLNYSIILFENIQNGHFIKRTRIDVHSWPTSMAAADYDNDGDLDLYICGYNPRGVTAAGDIFANPVPYHDANNGAPNFMMRSEGNWDFTDVTQEVGLDANNRRFSFAATWEDYDNDGDQDLYVANDFGRNNLYRNDRDAQGRSHFQDVAVEAGVEDIGAGMSVSWGDYNHDGWMDLYVSNMFSSAGNRIVSQQQFKESADESTRQAMQRHARGNSLFENQKDGTFRDVSLDAHVTLGRWAWGSLFTDLNNDSWDDLYVANGFFTTPDPGDL